MAELNALINISVQNQTLLQQVNAQFNQLNEKLNKTNEAVNKINSGFRRLFAGVLSTATLRQSVVQFEALERAETNLADSLSRNTKLGNGFADALRRQATELGRAGGFTRAQVTQLQGYTAVLGLAEKQTLDLNAAIVGLSQRSTAGVDEIAKSVQRAITSGEISETLGPLIGSAPAGFNRLTQEQRASFISNSQSDIFSNNNFARLFATLNDAVAEFARTINFVFGPAIRAFTSIVGQLNESKLSGPLLTAGATAGVGILGGGAIVAAFKQIASFLKPIIEGAGKLARIGGPIVALIASLGVIGTFFVGLIEGLTGIDDIGTKVINGIKVGINAIGDAFEVVIDTIQEGLDGLAGLGKAIGESFRTGNFSNILESASFYQDQRKQEREERRSQNTKSTQQDPISGAELARIQRELRRAGLGIDSGEQSRRLLEIAEAESRISADLEKQARAYRIQESLLSKRLKLLQDILAEEEASPLLKLEPNGQGEFSKQQLENYDRQARVVGEIREELKDVQIQLVQNSQEARDFATELVRIRAETEINNSEASGRVSIIGNVGKFADNETANRKLQIGLLRQRIALTENLISLSEKENDQERASELRVELVGLQEQVKQLQLELPLLGQVLSDNLVGSFDALIDGTKSVKQAFGDMVRSILADITKLLARAAVLGLLGAGFDSQAGGQAGGFFASLLNGFSGGRSGAYNGGIATTQGIKRFGGGGIVPGPSISRDIIPALLTPGEVVLNAAQQNRVASNLVSSAPSITNINAFDSNDILTAVAERQGQSVNLNVIRRNRQQVRRMLS